MQVTLRLNPTWEKFERDSRAFLDRAKDLISSGMTSDEALLECEESPGFPAIPDGHMLIPE